MKESRYNIWLQREDAAYVYNGVSGGLLRVSWNDHQSLQRFLSSADDVECPPRLLEQLVIGRMLIPDDVDELEMLSRRYHMSREDVSRFTLTIVTSLGCNFDCPYCFEAKHPSILEADVQDLVLAMLDDQLPKISGFYVTWFGGEPLVGKKALLNLSDEFIKRCDRAGVPFEANIVTNGFLLDEPTCTALHERRVKSAQIGLDGPPDVHNRMRPLAGKSGDSFWPIVENLHHALNYFNVSVRINVDKRNINKVEELLKILSAEGFAGKLKVYLGQVVTVDDGIASPSASYGCGCFSNREFAQVEFEFGDLCRAYGFSSPSLPGPTGAPCTAVRANELVVGSKGELYKCWDSVGNPLEVIGNVRDYRNTNGRLRKWLRYDPFKNDECRQCIALPVCMGGCAHHAMTPLLYENRCGTFRHTYMEQVKRFVQRRESKEAGEALTAAATTLERRMEMK